ncbi:MULTISPECIES: NUDIX hydrolase [Stutzerimonas stutzeri subgroup]|uniref:NUDIX hydrolase n=1 Tax=Stutzerimonas stutzeri subgroup TaxID=578833 RepID=UPI0011AF92E5|nr:MULTISPECIES: NUDIX hydrolase [Stutzerimonas stutzeri subgroup]
MENLTRREQPNDAVESKPLVCPPVTTFCSGVSGVTAALGSLHGIAYRPWRDHPASVEEWELPDIISPSLTEPPLEEGGKLPAAGAVIIEPDYRVWVAHLHEPFNAACVGFPTARKDPKLSLQATAIREAWERTGLKVRIIGWLGDFDEEITRTRYYLAARVGGAPAACGWERPTMSLVTLDALMQYPALRVSPTEAKCLAALQNVLNISPDWSTPSSVMPRRSLA